jgi:alpha-amylase
MPEIVVGFDAHQPYRVNKTFTPGTDRTSASLMDQYFDPMDREVILRASERCYTPATELILRLMDEGFACAFSASGTLLEQLERWSPDTLSLFEQLAAHRNTELIASPYYRGITGLFPDSSEFREEVRMQLSMLGDRFGRKPSFCANTDLLFDNRIAATLHSLRFRGAITEGVPGILGDMVPNHLFTCQVLPVLVRNTALSDDIALRFSDHGWDRFPLTAEVFARWVAASPGEVVTLWLNYETFGELVGKETGILDFLAYLPGELEKRDVAVSLPSDILDRYQPFAAVDVPGTISWSDLEKGTTSFLRNEFQQTAFRAIQNATPFTEDVHARRCLQAINHFYEMASPFGSGGERHAFLGHMDAREAFLAYMRVLADYEDRSMVGMGQRKYAMLVRSLPLEKSFHFASPAGDIGHTALNLDQFLDQLKVVPDNSLNYHLERGDLSRWAQEILDNPPLAKKIQKCSSRQELVATVDEARKEAWKHLR